MVRQTCLILKHVYLPTSDHLLNCTALLEPNTEHLELRDAVSHSQALPQLAMVPIYYNDLAGVDSDFIMLFADNMTTAKYAYCIYYIQQLEEN